MANRHLSRSIVLQTLFELDFNRGSTPQFAPELTAEGLTINGGKEKSEEVLMRNIAEFAPGGGDFSFMQRLLSGIEAKRSELDAIITKAAPEWPLERISLVDRNVLRLGLFELLFADRSEVPAKVAINEAIELGKAFGGESSGKFVNGVLGAVYREIGEPGKDEISKKKKKPADVPFEEMPVERLAGAVAYAREKGDVYLALVHDIFGHWTLSKGHLEEGEDETQGLVRVIKEEIGLSVTAKDKLGSNEYVASQPERGKIRKQVVYFLAETPYQDLKLEKKGGLDGAQWFKLADILDLNFYDDILPIVTKAINILLGKTREGSGVQGEEKRHGA